MKHAPSDTFTLENFQGPLDLLWHLISKQEIDIYEISIHTITEQYLDKCRLLAAVSLDRGAEFIAVATALIWLKSKTLLPRQEQLNDTPSFDEENDPRFEIIHQLIDYCRFKQAAKILTEREQSQSSFYHRGAEENEAKKNLGINHISLDDLASLFQQILAKAVIHKGTIHEEIWRVSDKIKVLQTLLNRQHAIAFTTVFTTDKGRDELITTFLALLELMKAGQARVYYDTAQQQICITKGNGHGT